MKQTVIRCDTCGEIGSETFTQWVDRPQPGADDSSEETINVDLCPKHTAKFLQEIFLNWRAHTSITDNQWRDIFKALKKYDFSKDEAEK